MFQTKDSGERLKFDSGMQRDITGDKTLWHLVASGPMLERWAELLTRGALKYDANNWMKAEGVAELDRFRESAFRHFMQWWYGDEGEDHAAAVMFNLNGAEYVKERLQDPQPSPEDQDGKIGLPRVYIAGPISKGDLAENIDKASDAYFELQKYGFAPLCPHWSCYGAGATNISQGGKLSVWAKARACHTIAHHEWVDIDLSWVEASNAVLRLPGDSVGADREVVHAVSLGIPVFHSIPDLAKYFGVEKRD